MKIRKGDRVVVLAGKDKGKEGEVIRVHPQGRQGRRRRRQRRQASPQAHQGHGAGRHHRHGDADPRLERGAHRPRRQAHPGRLPDRRRRHQGPRRAAHGSVSCHEHRPPHDRAPAQGPLQRRDPRPAPGRARPRQRHGGPPAREDRDQRRLRRRASSSKQLIDKVVAEITIIAGQKPVVTRAKKSIAGFKLREGNAIGVKVTLRGNQMWEFFDRLVTLAIPRIRDFRGLNPRALRRPWQLHVRCHRAVDLPGDRLRPGRCLPRHGHHDRDHRTHQCRGQGAPRRIQVPVPTRRAAVSHGNQGAASTSNRRSPSTRSGATPAASGAAVPVRCSASSVSAGSASASSPTPARSRV